MIRGLENIFTTLTVDIIIYADNDPIEVEDKVHMNDYVQVFVNDIDKFDKMTVVVYIYAM